MPVSSNANDRTAGATSSVWVTSRGSRFLHPAASRSTAKRQRRRIGRFVRMVWRRVMICSLHLSGRFRFPVTKRTIHPMDGCSGHRSIRLFCPVGCGRQRLAVDNPFPSGDGSVSPPVSAPRPEEPVIAVRRLRGGYPALPSVPPALPSAEASCPIRRPVPCRVVRARCIHPGWHC
ncbi:unknown [Alistipes sp. CAG:157]|nr:unknown [Alistipes sp. CAG:157]